MAIFIRILCALLGYAIGNFQSAIILSNAIEKKDIRNFGSGNAGSTNMLRAFGKRLGAYTFVLDVAKGVLAYLIGFWIGGETGGAIAGVAVVLGHNWPVIYGFKGGKGVAASLGVYLALMPLPALAVFGVSILVVALSKYMSVGSLMGATSLFLICLFTQQPVAIVIMSLILTALTYATHRENIRRLRTDSEHKTSFK